MKLGTFKGLAGAMSLMLTALAAGCGGGGDGGGAATAQPGTLSVSLTDAPACGYEQVNVTVEKVRVHQSSSDNPDLSGWREIVLPSPRKINLLDLNDPTQPNWALDYLGETSLAAGHYTQVRLVLVPNSGSPNPPFANSIVLQGQTQEIKLDTPSGVRSGIKLVNEFDVLSGQRVDLLLDFDACHSIVQTGNDSYKLKPVIKVIPYVLNGIEGYIDASMFPNQVNGNHVAVSAQVNGEVVRATVPNPVTGRFFLGRLAPGVNYDVVITANSPSTTCCATTVITGVPVSTSTSITPISTSSNRFSLQSSGFHTIGDTVTLINPPPVDDRDDATVIVAAKQALSGGPTVTVRSAVARLKAETTAIVGDYEYGLILPIEAPSRAAYGALPIVPSAISQGTVAGWYTIHGSATVYDDIQTPIRVYATQSPAPSSVNISTADNPDQDFTLAP